MIVKYILTYLRSFLYLLEHDVYLYNEQCGEQCEEDEECGGNRMCGQVAH